ncbi:MAG: Gfo/Idh/MocA family oxidoreductase [Pirellulales bacterium]
MSQVSALMIGTGEYTTGYVHGAAAQSDKGAGVVALTLFDLRRQGKIGQLRMAGTNGTKFPGIRSHLQRVVAQRYRGLAVDFESFPADDVPHDPAAYRQALQSMAAGDVVTVFTPDDTHFDIAMASVTRGCHVLIAKPLVKTAEQHLALWRAAEENGVLVAMEVHKRWDPIYADARDRIRSLGEFSFFSSYMSQPKSQLDTFRAWAGKSSDISYYLNAHHVDFNVWSVSQFARPVAVYASAATGVARGQGMPTEDTITLTVDWQNLRSGNRATAVYTASWIAPKSDVHSQQRFFYMGHEGEVHIDQAHRGYSLASDAAGYASPNPLFMKYEPDDDGCFAGQGGYGYRSIEAFVDAARRIRAGQAEVGDFQSDLATVRQTLLTTAILEAGRRSLDDDGRVYAIRYDEEGCVAGVEGRVV